MRLLVRVGYSKARAYESAIHQDSHDFSKFIFGVEITLLLLTGEVFNPAQKSFDEGGARVDLEHLLLLGELPHVLVVHLCVRGAYTS